MKFLPHLLMFSLMLSACASRPSQLETATVSSYVYQDYTCAQIQAEATRTSARLTKLHKNLTYKAYNDIWQATVGIIILPVLMLLEGGDGPEAAEYSQLKGEYAALHAISQQKSCPFKLGQELGQTSP